MNKLLLFLVLFFSVHLRAQSTKLQSNIDSSFVPGNPYIAEHSVSSFFSSGLGDEPIEYESIDTNLFNAALFFAINQERIKRKKKELQYEAKLEFLAYNCITYYSRHKFKPSPRNNLLYEKNLYLAARNMPLKCHLFAANTSLTSIMKTEPKRRFRRNPEDTTSTYQLFYRNPPELKDEPEDPVEVLTYNEFAKNVVKDFYSRKAKSRLNSKSYETMACFVIIEPKSMYKNREPYARVIQVIGARRLVLGQ